MYRVKRIVCCGIIFLCLSLVGCGPDAGRQSAEAKARREQKARDAEKIEEQREAADRAKREAAEKAKAKREEEAKIVQLNVEAQEQADAQIAQAKQEKKARLAALDPDAPKEQIAEQKKQIKHDYKEAVAKAKVELRYRMEAGEIESISLPEDATPRLNVKELRISGNSLIPTSELLEKMPLVYNASDKPLSEAESEALYDFRVLVDIILQPGPVRQVSARTIQGLTQYILSVYQSKNYAGIYVYVPAEAVKKGMEVQDGILPIEVLEAEVIKVSITQYDPNQNVVEKGYILPSAIEEWSPIKPGEVANQKELDDFVNLLNLNPDRYVSAVVTQGDEPKTLAVRYDIYEADPWHWFWQIDNSGTRDKQWTPRIGLINTSLLGIDDTFTAIYQAPWDKTIDEDYSIYGSYDFPLSGPRLRLNLYGGYSQYDINPEAGDIDFIGNGHFYGGILRYNVLQTEGWFFDVTGSLGFERSKVTPSLFPDFLGSNVRMWPWGVGANLHRRDDISNTSLGFERSENMQGGSDKEEFAIARTGAKPDFTIYRASAAHSQYLDPNKIERFSATFRWVAPTVRLVPAKMTTFGGMYTVRGYDEYEVVADGGILASAQYEFDIVRYNEVKDSYADEPEEAETEAEKSELKKLAPLVFFDYGRAKVRHPATTTEKGHVEMFSVGAGTIVEIGDNFSGGVYYGYPLRETDDTRRNKGRVSVSLMMRW